MTRKNALVLGTILAVLAVGQYIHTLDNNLRAPLAFGVIAAALITFFSGISDPTSRGATSDGIVRKAIALSLVVEYLVLVGTFAFWGGATEQLAPMTQQLITSFTTIVGIVIAFYFGSSAYVEAKGKTLHGSGTRTDTDES